MHPKDFSIISNGSFLHKISCRLKLISDPAPTITAQLQSILKRDDGYDPARWPDGQPSRDRSCLEGQLLIFDQLLWHRPPTPFVFNPKNPPGIIFKFFGHRAFRPRVLQRTFSIALQYCRYAACPKVDSTANFQPSSIYFQRPLAFCSQ